MLDEVEQNLGVGQPVIQNLKRACVADDFGQFGQPGQVPPRQRAEPEYRSIERGQQQNIEIPVGDVGALMRQHGPALRQIPIDALRGKQDG